MASDRSKRRDLLACIFITKSWTIIHKNKELGNGPNCKQHYMKDNEKIGPVVK